MESQQNQHVGFRELMDSLTPLSTPPQARRTTLGENPSRLPVGDSPDPRRACVKGERNNHIARLAGKWLHRGYAVDDVLTLALAANARFAPPLADSEVAATCDSIAKTHGRNTGVAPSAEEVALEPLFVPQNFKASRYFGTEPPARRWLFQDVFPCGKVALLVAPGGTGKSMFAIQLGVSTATGVSFADVWEAGETGGVLMLLGEDDDEELHRRTLNIFNQLALSRASDDIFRRGENLIIKSMVGEDNLLTTTDQQSREVKQTALVNRLILTAQQIPNLKLIVIDPASRFRGGDENASQDVTRFVEALERVAQATGAAVLIIHHANKGSMNSSEQHQSASRGSSALTDGVRLQINLATLDQSGAKSFGIAEELRKSYLTLSVTKTNYGAPQQDIILRRGEGGYLSNANLTPVKMIQVLGLEHKIVEIVKREAQNGKNHSRSAFAETFGGVSAELRTGNNTVRTAVGSLVDSGKLTYENRTLGVPKVKPPKLSLETSRKKADGPMP